jgi:hypothetical protein
MNPITKALDEVMFRIPREILKVVFQEPYQQFRDLPSDIKERIRFMVLAPRVLVDCNLVNGVETRIDLSDVPRETVENGYVTVFQIPKTKTNGRAILSVFDVTYGYLANLQSGYGGNYGTGRGSPALSMASQVMEAQLRTGNIGTARVELIGENVVMVQDAMILPQNMYLRCSLENDENLSNIQARSYLAFARLVELAVKSFIYNSYIIQLDMGELRGGVQVGKFKEIVEGYSDAEMMYREYLDETWAKVAFMNDPESMTRYISLISGIGR